LHSQGLKPTKVINSGATLSNTGKLGKSYSLTTGNYIGLDAANKNNHKYSPISLAMWICVTQAVNSTQPLLCCWEDGGAGLLVSSDQKLGFTIYKSGYKYCYSETINLNQWYHVCGTYDNTTMKLYINGQLIATTTVGGAITYHSTCPWEIGGNPGKTSFAAGNVIGKISDVRIYNHALSAKEVEEIAKGLVLHYKLN